MKLINKITVYFISSLLLLCLIGCQAVFTASLFKDVFAPDVSQIPPAQLAGYYEGVLINGTPEEKAAALDSIQTAIDNGNTDPELNYIAGVLVLDTIGVSVDNIITMMSDPEGAADLLTADNLALIEDMGTYLYTADQGGVELTDTDMVFCGIGLLLQTVELDNLDSVDINNPTPEQAAAVALINEGAASSDILQGIIALLWMGA